MLQVESKKGKWTEEEINILTKFYGEIPTKDIAEMVGRSRDAVQIKGRRLGLKYEDKYFYNKSFFHTIDTAEKAYWLGFVTADGSVIYDTEKRQYGLDIKLQIKDKGHLRKFNKSIEGNVGVSSFARKGDFPDKQYNDNYYGSCSIRLYCQEIADDLISLGVVPNKTYKTIKLPKINSELMWHYIRGFLDGDGHICVPQGENKYGYRVGFTSNCEPFLLEIKNFFTKYGIVSHINTSRNTYKLEMRSLDSVKIFIENCYKDSSVYLERKYTNYKQLEKLLS